MVTTVLVILTVYLSNQKALSDVNVGSRCARGRSYSGLSVIDALLLVTKADNRPGKAQRCSWCLRRRLRGGGTVRAQGWRRCLTQFPNVDWKSFSLIVGGKLGR